MNIFFLNFIIELLIIIFLILVVVLLAILFIDKTRKLDKKRKESMGLFILSFMAGILSGIMILINQEWPGVYGVLISLVVGFGLLLFFESTL